MHDQLTVDRETLAQIRRVLIGMDSYLSYLRHRAAFEIPWGTTAMMLTQSDCDRRIGEARVAEQILDSLLWVRAVDAAILESEGGAADGSR